ncbi:cyclic lactone autoinducer peptide [Marinisporobacter balticus]|uniref:Cyclic lactone autoinducer peptide n=1 Tax=Marinisporobacter balticus TaxID=2018667 RepID=A0A4R2KTH8_9FIRM|nr:cyclic lactone autoinducer peptide [Marinisporobacter balticus]TCO74379.1 cyclic lactone autoinducer peptide [Marinisporobacter balticus]
MMRRLLQLSISVLTFLALTNVAAACTTANYQPELPEQLKDM